MAHPKHLEAFHGVSGGAGCSAETEKKNREGSRSSSDWNDCRSMRDSQNLPSVKRRSYVSSAESLTEAISDARIASMSIAAQGLVDARSYPGIPSSAKRTRMGQLPFD